MNTATLSSQNPLPVFVTNERLNPTALPEIFRIRTTLFAINIVTGTRIEVTILDMAASWILCDYVVLGNYEVKSVWVEVTSLVGWAWQVKRS